MITVFMTVNGDYGHFYVSAAGMHVGAASQLIRWNVLLDAPQRRVPWCILQISNSGVWQIHTPFFLKAIISFSTKIIDYWGTNTKLSVITDWKTCYGLYFLSIIDLYSI